jgi:hypothetical protein
VNPFTTVARVSALVVALAAAVAALPAQAAVSASGLPARSFLRVLAEQNARQTILIDPTLPERTIYVHTQQSKTTDVLAAAGFRYSEGAIGGRPVIIVTGYTTEAPCPPRQGEPETCRPDYLISRSRYISFGPSSGAHARVESVVSQSESFVLEQGVKRYRTDANYRKMLRAQKREAFTRTYTQAGSAPITVHFARFLDGDGFMGVTATSGDYSVTFYEPLSQN